jgi:hypothetical protein
VSLFDFGLPKSLLARLKKGTLRVFSLGSKSSQTYNAALLQNCNIGAALAEARKQI